MKIVDFTPLSALSGGVLIGLSAGLALLLGGKIAGISGIVARLFRPVPGERAWRLAFLLGLVGGAALTFALWPATAAFELEAGLPRVLGAGFLVGLGTRLGGGCTSGHGVCGLARGSRPSLLATLVFMGTAMLTVFAMRHLLATGGAA